MLRTLSSMSAVFLILTCTSSAVTQEKPFKNKTALAAKKSYEEAIAKAKKEYADKLEIAIKEAGGAGDIDEANRLVAEKKQFGSDLDPVETATKRIAGTRWGEKPSSTHKFHVDRRITFAGGYPDVWIMSDPRTMILQSSTSSAITVWKFNEKLTSARIYTFSQTGKPYDFKKFR